MTIDRVQFTNLPPPNFNEHQAKEQSLPCSQGIIQDKFGQFPYDSIQRIHQPTWTYPAVNPFRHGGPSNALLTPQHEKIFVIKNSNLRDTVAGIGAAGVYVVSTYPLSKIQFRQQLNCICIGASLRQIYEEGLKHLYRGLLPPLLQKTASRGIMFGTFDLYRNLLGEESLMTTFLAGNLAGWTEGILTPFERIQTLMQDRQYHDRFRNSYHAYQEIRDINTKEFFRGGSVVFLRNGLSNAMFFALREPISDSLDLSSKFIRSFVSGAILGAVISTIFYPFNVVKTRMQSKIGGDYQSMVRTFFVIYREREGKMGKFFMGYHVNYTRAILSWGIVNAVYESLRGLLTDD